MAVADGVQLGFHAAFCPTNQASTPPLFDAQTGRRSMGLQVGGVDHQSLLLAAVFADILGRNVRPGHCCLLNFEGPQPLESVFYAS